MPETLTVEGCVVLKLEDKIITLRGRVGEHIKVHYHRAFDKALAFGTIPQIAKTLADALGFDGKAFGDTVSGGIQTLNKVPGLGSKLEHMVIRLTDLVIDTETSEYEFGLCLDLSNDPVKVQGVELRAVGANIKYKKPVVEKQQDFVAAPRQAALTPVG